MQPDIQWVAGFLEADGWFGIHSTNASNHCETARVEATNTDRATLDRIFDITKMGKVYGPYEQRGLGKKEVFKWRCHRQQEVFDVCTAVRPHLVSYKADTVDRLLLHLEGRGYGVQG